MSRAAPYPTFSAAEYARRDAAVRTLLAREGLDCLVAYGSGRAADVYYLSGWPGTRESVLLYPREGDATLLVQLYNHVPNARRMSRFPDVRWGGPRTGDALLAALRERAPKRIGIVGALPWKDYEALRRGMPALACVDFGGALALLRATKSGEELERLRRAARFTDLAMRALEQEVRPGLREDQLATIVESSYGKEGGTHGIHFMATTPMRDPAIGVPSQIQSTRAIERGDVLITEISAEYWGYTGQIHRAYAIGAEPSAELQRLHDVAVEAYERMRQVLRDGATVADILTAADVIQERGCTVYDDLLHGASQLPPIIQTRQTARTPVPDFTFREDMVVVIQPNVVANDARVGLQVGETLRVTRIGTERLHDYPMRFIRCG